MIAQPVHSAARASAGRPCRLLADLRRALAYLAVVALAVAFVIPFVWSIGTSLKTPIETTQIPPTLFPAVPQWSNYALVLSVVPMAQFAANTVLLTAINVVGQTLTGSLVAYGFARFRFHGRNVLFLLLLSTIMLPREVLVIPQYVLYSRLHWIDTYWPMIVPHWLGGGAFIVFLLRQFFLTIPRDYDDAAYCDGASPLQILFQIIYPLSRPAMITVALFSFMGNWNDLWTPLIYLSTPSKFTLALGLTWFQATGFNFPKTELLLAYSLLMTTPIIILFFLLQRYFIQGIVLTGIKG